MIITQRFYLPNGYACHRYYVGDDVTDPANDPQLDVRPGDELVRLFVDSQGNEVRRQYVRNRENSDWEQANHWGYIEGKPVEFTPVVHDLGGDRHSGNLHISRVTGHTRNNTVHVQIRLEAVMMAVQGKALASSTSI